MSKENISKENINLARFGGLTFFGIFTLALIMDLIHTDLNYIGKFIFLFVGFIIISVFSGIVYKLFRDVKLD